MCKNNNSNKIIITMQELMQQMDISDKTLHRMIEESDLPDFTYGSKRTKKKGWHVAVLERHAMEKYERSNSMKNIGHVRQIGGEDVAVVPLGDRHRSMPEKGGDLNNRDTAKQKLSGKEVPGRVRPSAGKSRIATGYTNMPT